MRILIVVKFVATAKAAYATIENSTLLLDPTQMRPTLADFAANPNAILIGTAQLLATGYRVPEGTLVVCGPDLSDAERIQAYARVRPTLDPGERFAAHCEGYI